MAITSTSTSLPGFEPALAGLIGLTADLATDLLAGALFLIGAVFLATGAFTAAFFAGTAFLIGFVTAFFGTAFFGAVGLVAVFLAVVVFFAAAAM